MKRCRSTANTYATIGFRVRLNELWRFDSAFCIHTVIALNCSSDVWLLAFPPRNSCPTDIWWNASETRAAYDLLCPFTHSSNSGVIELLGELNVPKE